LQDAAVQNVLQQAEALSAGMGGIAPNRIMHRALTIRAQIGGPLGGQTGKLVLDLSLTGFDPKVWSGRAVQEVSSILAMRSCINVSGL
jgi:hypothetical protein